MAAGKQYKRFAGQSVNNAAYHNENWDRFFDGNALYDVGFDSLADAITYIGTTNRKTLYITTKHRITKSRATPSNISLKVLDGGKFDLATGVELAINGGFEAGDYQVFSWAGTGAVSFGTRQKRITPYWWGAVGDNGVTDDTDALLACLAAGGTQYAGPRVDLCGGRFGFTSRLKIQSPVYGRGAMLIAMGSGDDFTYATNPDTAGGVAVPDCAVLLVDGGSIDGASVVAKAALDVTGNQGTYLICCQAIYGKTPLINVRINGDQPGRYLNGLAVRYCTTSNFLGIGGAYFKNGFFCEASNWCNFDGIFFEHLRYGGTPFKWYDSQGCTVNGMWVEGWQGGSDLYHILSCSGFRVQGLKIGEPAGIAGAGAASFTGTADAGTDVITTASDYQLADTMPLSVVQAVAGITVGQIVFARDVSGLTFKVAATSGGAAINLGASGTVEFRKAAQSGVHVENCERMRITAYGNETGTAYQKRIGWVTGSSSDITMDSSFDATADSYGKLALEEFGATRSRMIENIDISDYTIPQYIGRVDYGTRMTVRITARTSGFSGTDGDMILGEMTGAGTFTTRATLTPSSGALSSPGNVASFTVDVDTAGEWYIMPNGAPAGGGVADILIEFKKVSGNTFV